MEVLTKLAIGLSAVLLLGGAVEEPLDNANLHIDLPFFPEGYDVDANEIVSDLIVLADGSQLWDGEAFARNQLAERLKTIPCPAPTPLQGNQFSDQPSPNFDKERIRSLQLNPVANAKYDAVRSVLTEIKSSGICTFKFADLAAFENFEVGSKAPALQSEFDKKVLDSEPGSFSVHVTTTDPYIWEGA